jgi:hypothetical protein
MARSQKSRKRSLRAFAANGTGDLGSRRRLRVEAIALLAPIYNRFTEGFETANLKTAKALIDSLPLTAGARRDEVARLKRG